MERIFRILVVVFLLVPGGDVLGQEGPTVLRGRVECRGAAVPYASLQLQGTSIGVASNDAGEFELKLPAGTEIDTVVVRSVGYVPVKVAVGELAARGVVRLEEQAVTLRAVEVKSWRSAQHLLEAAVRRIDSNYCQQTSWSTFFYRDWRAVDGELYLFDEAVLSVRRKSYAQYADKRGYHFANDRREMATNYKTLLRHRLVVYDRTLLEGKVNDPAGVNEMMEYADNEDFYDPMSTPQASFALSRRTLAQHKFEPLQEFVADGEVFYLVRSVGPGHISQAKVHYEYTIRKSDLAIVAITAAHSIDNMMASDDAWVNMDFSRMAIDKDSSAWSYDVREGRYTLTHYYNSRTLHLGTGDRWRFVPQQGWQRCVDWTLTDFGLQAPASAGEVLKARPQNLAGAFGESDYNADFWGHYNTVLIDSLPLRLLKEKLSKIKRDEKN